MFKEFQFWKFIQIPFSADLQLFPLVHVYLLDKNFLLDMQEITLIEMLRKDSLETYH